MTCTRWFRGSPCKAGGLLGGPKLTKQMRTHWRTLLINNTFQRLLHVRFSTHFETREERIEAPTSPVYHATTFFFPALAGLPPFCSPGVRRSAAVAGDDRGKESPKSQRPWCPHPERVSSSQAKSAQGRRKSAQVEWFFARSDRPREPGGGCKCRLGA